MADMSTTAAMCIVIALVKQKKRREKKKRKRTWTREWIKNRPRHGAYHHLINELRLWDQASYRNFLRMDVSSFESLLNLVAPFIRKQDTVMRQSISPVRKTLRYFATG